jgi:uncharacterized integral membrane protein
VSDLPRGDAHAAAAAPAASRAARFARSGRVNQPGVEPEPERAQKRSLTERLEENRQTWQPALWSRLLAIGVIVVYLILFIVLNTHHVKISFVFASTRVPVVLAILVSLVLGVVLGVFASQLHRYRRRRR